MRSGSALSWALTATFMAPLFSCGPRLQHKSVATRTYASNANCAQDLASTAFIADGARWGESITVVACGMHAIAGHIEISADRVDVGRIAWSYPFGDRADNGRCLASDAEVAAAGRNPTDTAATTGTPTSRGRPAKTQSPGATTAFQPVSWSGEVCPGATSTNIGLSQLHPGSEIRVRVWSQQPNDVSGAMLRIVHNVDEPNVSDEKWQAHLDREEERWRREDQRRAEEERLRPGQKTRFQPKQPAAPPPAPRSQERPPQPSVNAQWIPGYWHWTENRWIWLAGQWRVPDADVAAGLTVTAPHGPPTPRNDSRPPAPAVGMVWVAGYWLWNGGTYVWVRGHWRFAPRVGVRWRGPTWRPGARGVVFVPGRWIGR